MTAASSTEAEILARTDAIVADVVKREFARVDREARWQEARLRPLLDQPLLGD